MSDLLDQARRTADEAHWLLDGNWPVGAVSRAYYAMYSAARAALQHVDPKLNRTKTHGGLLRQFSKHIVRERGFDSTLAKALRQASEVRMEADYDSATIGIEAAKTMVASMDEFVAAVAAFLEIPQQ